jgi:hypothetical protein
LKYNVEMRIRDVDIIFENPAASYYETHGADGIG